MNIKGKTAIITGGNSGIGKATARKLGEEGCRVAICGRSQGRLRETAEELRSQGIEVFQKPCDVRDREQVAAWVNEVAREFDLIDILVNNAGISGYTPLDQPQDEVWQDVLKTNLDGTYYATCRTLTFMPNGGRIINISSVLGRFGVPGYAAYCSAKHGVIGFTRAAALELAPRKITVNAICPGWVETDMARQGMERGADSMGVSYAEFRKRALRQVPLGEMIEPHEIAGLVSFLAAPAAKNITGQTYNLCGGQVMS